MRLKNLLVLAAAIVLSVPSMGQAQQKARFATRNEALAASGILAGGSGPASVNWIDGGRRFSYIARTRTGSQIRGFDPTTGEDTLIFEARGVTYPGSDEPFAYDSFQWAHDSRHLVYQSRFQQIYRRSGTAEYYVYDLDTRRLTLAARGARTAELSPDGSMLAYERDGDMFVRVLAREGERRLTDDATATLYNGHFDWVYEEEFGLAQAWNWSPDSRFVAFWQVDESAEPLNQFTDFAGAHPEYTKIRIPQPGDANPTVRIGVVDVRSGQKVWLDPGLEGDHYVPRLYWTSEADTLAMITLNRPQTEMRVYFFDVRTGGRRLVFTQRAEAWIDVFDFYANILDMMTFPAGRHEFFWISDEDGWQHIYRYGYDGRLIGRVTRGEWNVTRIEGIDLQGERVFYSSTEDSPLQRQLYVIGFDGRGKRRISSEEGTHQFDMSPDTAFYIDTWSSVEEPQQAALRSSDGRMVKMFADNTSTRQWLDSHAYAPTTLFQFETSDGVKLDGSLVLPFGFDESRRYPVVFAIYGGPGSQQVYDEFGSDGWTQWLAQEGYVVVGLNNRGTNNYGRDFMKVVYKYLGKWESHDFAEAAKYLATKPWVDPDRIAIMGTSYGGYSTLYTMEMYPEIFSVGISNSPVTDWTLYDTIYTERYMGLLGDNPEGYTGSSAIRNASKLTGNLLLVHSMMDDNVHPRNTMQFITALTDAGHDAEVRIYPPGRHGAVYNGPSYLLLYGVYDEFLARYLK